jgi:hypothetical protein
MRYNFHDQLSNVHKNPKYVLPADINQPVIDFLEKIGCTIGVKLLRKMQQNVNYGSIDLIHDDVPSAKITIQVDCGMAEGYKIYDLEKVGKWNSISYRIVKNKNLDKKKVTPKEKTNE